MGDRLATVDMGRKEGGCCAPFREGEFGPIYYNVAWAEAYLRTKWHLDSSSRLAATDMGRKLGATMPLLGGGRWVPK